MIFVKNGPKSKRRCYDLQNFNRNLIWVCLEVLANGGMCCPDILAIHFDQMALRSNPKDNILIVTTVRRRNLTKLYFIHGGYVLNYGRIYLEFLCT